MPRLDPSPSRTYVAMCNTSNFNGFYFRKFVLPENIEPCLKLPDGWKPENSADSASWYFLNFLNSWACVERVFAYEDYMKIEEQNSPAEVPAES